MIICFRSQRYWSPCYQRVSLAKIASLYQYYIIADISDNGLNTTIDTNTNRTVDIAPANITIIVPPEVFNVSNDEVGYVVTFYSAPSLFQLKVPEGVNMSDYEFVVDSAVVGLTISRDPKELSMLTQPVVITLQSHRAFKGQVCVSSI